ncbi:hypothetical protein AcW1_001154 [Taiwanofungus camphoratus]|nr:hypothetical protein AcW2_000334 [Antrodia cinnamomea]KAI0937089.1 hypothetical protein AcV5_005067 [Antrodia cinnamomea]KAI0964308.1 hypothetical protein AcW1_001154 [Antrodia cinnamomea]
MSWWTGIISGLYIFEPVLRGNGQDSPSSGSSRDGQNESSPSPSSPAGHSTVQKGDANPHNTAVPHAKSDIVPK